MNALHGPQHILTINLEDYFQVGAFNKYIQQNRWQRFESRIEINTSLTLELLNKYETQATFFVLGWIAEKFPQIIRQVAAMGHEVAVRGFYHRTVHGMTPEEFATDTIRARDTIENITGQKCLGYRLADGWFTENDLWALDELAKLGFLYDSSIAPIGSSFANDPVRHSPHEHRSPEGSILELPVSTGKILGFRVPVAGGNYLRQIPTWLTRRAIQRWVKNHPTPLVAYFHTWEMDPDQPRISAVSSLTRLRHYRNLPSMPKRIEDLLKNYSFSTVANHLNAPIETAPERSQLIPLSQVEDSNLAEVSNSNRVAISIVIPVYNEEQLIPFLQKTLDEVQQKLRRQYDITFIIVDDGSQDNTWQALLEAFGNVEDFQLLRQNMNTGVMGAILTGIRAAGTEIVCSMDSDCSYDPLKLQEMIPLLTPEVDLVTASPYHPAGGVKNVPGWRLTLSKGCAWLYRRVLTIQLATYTSCFRVYRRSAMITVPLNNLRYLGVAELIGRLDERGGTVREYPAVLEVRMLGRSKMKTVRTIFGHLRLLLSLSLSHKRAYSIQNRDEVIRSQLDLIRKMYAVPPDQPLLSTTPPPKSFQATDPEDFPTDAHSDSIVMESLSQRNQPRISTSKY